MLTILLKELCIYIAATPTTRNIREGQEIINSGLLIMCGVTERTAANIQLYALCLETSGITSDPHVVTGNLTMESSVYFRNNDIFVKKMDCSCKAGSSHCCSSGSSEFFSSVFLTSLASCKESYKPIMRNTVTFSFTNTVLTLRLFLCTLVRIFSLFEFGLCGTAVFF